MKILIGADLVPTASNAELFNNGCAAELVGQELLDILQSADYRIFNLETPLTDKVSPIAKCGPALVAGTATVNGYTALGVDLLTLANNHIMDQGEQGLWSTQNVLNAKGIAYVGAGSNLAEASKPYYFEIQDKKIGIYACAEHEFSIAEAKKTGANPFDPLESLDHIVAMKGQCDYVIVLYHGGKEHYRYPSPNLQKVCRKLVEKGADFVLCQHSHCIGCEEKYLDGTIVYGQGNFLFDDADNAFWQTSLLVQIGDNFEVSYIPLVKQGNGVRQAGAMQGREILAAFHERSVEILQEDFVEERYAEFAKDMRNHYLLTFSGMRRGILYRILNKLLAHRLDDFEINRKYGDEKLLAIRNFVECEAHRELLVQGIYVETIE